MDKIVYTVWTSGGGVDGRDPSDVPRARFATFDKLEAEDAVGTWDQKSIRSEIVDIEMAKKEALAKLSAVDRLVLGLLPEKAPNARKNKAFLEGVVRFHDRDVGNCYRQVSEGQVVMPFDSPDQDELSLRIYQKVNMALKQGLYSGSTGDPSFPDWVFTTFAR